MKIQRISAIFSIILFFPISIFAQNFIQINGNLKSGTPINNLVLSRFNGQEIPVTDTKVNDGKFLFSVPVENFQAGVYRIIINPQQRKFVDIIIADTLGFDVSIDGSSP